MAQKPVYQSTDAYLLLLAGDVALKLIRIALNDYDKSTSIKPEDPFNNTINLEVEGDRRITNRVYETLQKHGALTSFTSWRPESYSYYHTSRKERMWYSGRVSETWFNTFAPAHAVAPVFETSGLVTKAKDTWSTDTERVLKTEFQNYRKVSSYQKFTDAEYLYIWLHLDEYDVRTLEETHQGSTRHGFGSSTTKYKVIYPKALLQDLSKGVFEGHAENYVEKHIQWAIKNVLGIKEDKVINHLDMSTPPKPECKIVEFKNWTEDFVRQQLERISCWQTLLKMSQESYTRLLSKVEVYGGWDKFRECSKQDFLKYLEENFPLHIGGDEKDKELKQLCEWVAEGRNKGFNERLQIIQAGGTKCSPSNVTTQ
jgi:hypothetical protein